AATLGSTGSAGDLNHKLRQALRRPKVRAQQSLVGIDDGHQAHVRQMVALGQHLRADQNAAIAAVDAFQQAGHRSLAASAVTIDADDAVFRETCFQFLLQPLRPLADGAQFIAAAVWTCLWRQALMGTVVAAQAPIMLVKSEPGVTAITGSDPG